MPKKKKMDILYEDKDLLVVNKPSHLLTIATSKENVNTLYHEAREYVKKQNPKNKIFIVHRLDKDTSGVIVFAKKETVKKELQSKWNEKALVREYIGIVEGKLKKVEDRLTSYLKEDKNHKVYESKTGDLAITHYKVLGSNKSYTLVKIRIETGRKNQIRVQFQNLNHPLIGDKKYGSTNNRLGLHASLLKVEYQNKNYCWVAKIPKEFKRMFPKEIERLESSYGKITKSNCE